MARAYFSTIFEKNTDEIWNVIRDFSNYEWSGGPSETHMEEGRSGDAVGGARHVRLVDRTIRQRLIVHSDRDRTYTYEFCDPTPFPVRNYQATLRVTPVTDGDTAFIEWWATFDCDIEECAHWVDYFENQGFSKWLQSLRIYLAS